MDKYTNKYPALLSKQNDDDKICEIINQIYQDGFADGHNEAEIDNNE